MPARVTQTLVVLVLAQRGIFAVESALATEGDEIGVAQQPNGLALFLDDQVRRNHFGNLSLTTFDSSWSRSLISLQCVGSDRCWLTYIGVSAKSSLSRLGGRPKSTQRGVLETP